MNIIVLALDLLLMVATFIVMLALLAAIVRMLRTGRRKYLLGATAACAWALASWAGIADGIPAIRGFLGAWTLAALITLAQLVFVGLTLAVFRYVWGWLRAPRGARDDS
jgi:hypothetical protein